MGRVIPERPDPANRAEHDFYRTPRRGVEELLRVEQFKGSIWEPACGDGAISEVLIERGHTVFSTDLIDRGYGGQLDFIKPHPVNLGAENVITNPPFTLAQQFAETALSVTNGKVALLCRLLWLEGMKRRTFFRDSKLSRVWVFSERLNVSRNGDERWRDGRGGRGGMVCFAWFIWDREHVGKTEIDWL